MKILHLKGITINGSSKIADIKVQKAITITEVKWSKSSIKYGETSSLHIQTQNVTDGEKLVIKIVDLKTQQKVKEWDKAEDNEIELTAQIQSNKCDIEFSPTDKWFSKRALNKTVCPTVYYMDSLVKTNQPKLVVNKINYNFDMKLSDNGMKVLAHSEALAMICPDGKIRAYLDKVDSGNWTIGYGEMTGITPDTTIESKEEAMQRFKNRISKEFEPQVRRELFSAGVKRKLKQYEFDALVDISYNAWRILKIAERIADEETLTEQHFISHINKGNLTSRRKKAYLLFTNQIKSINGPTEFYRKDNTNEGYKKRPKLKQAIDKDGKKVYDEHGNPKMEEVKDKNGNVVMEKGYYTKSSSDVYTISYNE